jgi:hypothetical protein
MIDPNPPYGERGGASWRQRLREFHAVQIPATTRFGRCAGKHPEFDPFPADSKQIGESLDRPARVCKQPVATVEQVLGRIVGRVANERFRVDHKPMLPLRPENIARVQIGR